MTRFFSAFIFSIFCLFAQAADLQGISNLEASSGLKEVLTKGAEYAVANLGKTDGFMGNPKVRIGLPDGMKKAESLLRTLRMGKYADELTLAMNRAAEQAVVEAKPILVNAIKKMTVQDAKAILVGGNDSVTQFFRRSTSDELTQKFLPVVKRSTSKVGLAQKYDKFAGKASQMKLIDKENASIDQYVTSKALDGLYLLIAEQESSIRQNPMGAGSSLLKKVFGAF